MKIETTLERTLAFIKLMQHEHISYGEEGQLLLQFLKDCEAAIVEHGTSIMLGR